MAAEARFQQHGRGSRWLGPFIASELAWLRANADVLAKLDARQWEPVAGDQAGVVIDDGYEESEVA